MTIKKWLVILIVALIILLGILAWKHSQPSMPSTTSPATTETSTTTGALPPGVSVIPGTNITLTQPQPQQTSVAEPALNRPIPTNSGLDASAVASLTASLNTAVANLQKNRTSFTDWINLGFYRKALGDYVGAGQAWEYVSLLYPKNSVSFGDLGDLYTNFLNDTAKAELNYQAGIKNTPQNIDFYRNLFNLYISENKNSQAVALLNQGIAANPNNSDLKILLEDYQKNHQ